VLVSHAVLLGLSSGSAYYNYRSSGGSEACEQAEEGQSMKTPFPRPKNANEARGNMIHWATVAEEIVVAGAAMASGITAIEKAKMWAAIALTLPEEQYTELIVDDQVVCRWHAPDDDLGLLEEHILTALAHRYIQHFKSHTFDGSSPIVSEAEIRQVSRLNVVFHQNDNGTVTVNIEP
jgi:hypothetical protein